MPNATPQSSASAENKAYLLSNVSVAQSYEEAVPNLSPKKRDVNTERHFKYRIPGAITAVGGAFAFGFSFSVPTAGASLAASGITVGSLGLGMMAHHYRQRMDYAGALRDLNNIPFDQSVKFYPKHTVRTEANKQSIRIDELLYRARTEGTFNEEGLYTVRMTPNNCHETRDIQFSINADGTINIVPESLGNIQEKVRWTYNYNVDESNAPLIEAVDMQQFSNPNSPIHSNFRGFRSSDNATAVAQDLNAMATAPSENASAILKETRIIDLGYDRSYAVNCTLDSVFDAENRFAGLSFNLTGEQNRSVMLNQDSYNRMMADCKAKAERTQTEEVFFPIQLGNDQIFALRFNPTKLEKAVKDQALAVQRENSQRQQQSRKYSPSFS